MCWRSFFFVIILLLYITTCFGIERSDNSLVNNNNNSGICKIRTFGFNFRDSWIGKDKVDHFLVSAFLTAGSFYVFTESNNMSQSKSKGLSIGFALSLGIAKEVKDGFSKGRSASLQDLLANILGVGAGVFLFN